MLMQAYMNVQEKRRTNVQIKAKARKLVLIGKQFKRKALLTYKDKYAILHVCKYYSCL